MTWKTTTVSASSVDSSMTYTSPPFWVDEFIAVPQWIGESFSPCFGCGQPSKNNMFCLPCQKDSKDCRCEVTPHTRARWLNVAFDAARPMSTYQPFWWREYD